jgi:hypothetical protein
MGYDTRVDVTGVAVNSESLGRHMIGTGFSVSSAEASGNPSAGEVIGAAADVSIEAFEVSQASSLLPNDSTGVRRSGSGAASGARRQGAAAESDGGGAPETPDLLGEAAVPLFLARFDAAWIYAELTTMYVSHLERVREYELACDLLRALLGGSACPGRR